MIGTARAKGLTMLGDALSAEDAERWGLIWGCVDDNALMSQAEALVQRFAAGPTQAYTRITSMFNQEPARLLPEQLAMETVAQSELGDTKDFAEGVQAFRSKRAPKFVGS
jgi:2-(1,2-epoxy-1,2-dihydrophenyl)acetyl-CoA isomerase